MSSFVAYLKTVWYLLGAFLFVYLDIPQEQLSILVALMVIDFITWVSKWLRINPKKITSHEATMGVLKKITVLIAIFAVALAGKSVGFQMEGFLVWTIAIITVAELYSILQNCYAVMTGTILSEFDALSLVIRSLGEMVRNMLEKLLENWFSKK